MIQQLKVQMQEGQWNWTQELQFYEQTAYNLQNPERESGGEWQQRFEERFKKTLARLQQFKKQKVKENGRNLLELKRVFQYIQMISFYIVNGYYNRADNFFTKAVNFRSKDQRQKQNQQFFSQAKALRIQEQVRLWSSIRSKLKSTSNDIVSNIYEGMMLKDVLAEEELDGNESLGMSQSLNEEDSEDGLDSTHQSEKNNWVIQYQRILEKIGVTLQEKFKTIRRSMLRTEVSRNERTKIQELRSRSHHLKPKKSVLTVKSALNEEFTMSSFQDFKYNSFASKMQKKKVVGRAVSYSQIRPKVSTRDTPKIVVNLYHPVSASPSVTHIQKKNKLRKSVFFSDFTESRQRTKGCGHLRKVKYQRLFGQVVQSTKCICIF